ncbi:hypothetical protein HN903_00350 [archaeon]|jgi:hypothetical protein|nr:hypothetical protein [archaeon]MBT6955766.1 hypothetical protein [archaeon]MBT7128186.1 hypothetical protein [archaeon]
MALEDVMVNLSEFVSVFPADVSDKILGLILILKALGVVAIFYFIYVVVMGIFTYRRIKKVDQIEEKANKISKKVNSIDKKLNKLLKQKS